MCRNIEKNWWCRNIFLKNFFVPRTWSGCYDQISEFFDCESSVLFGFTLIYHGSCFLAAHSSVHASFILRRGLTIFKLPKSFLGLRIVEFFWYTGMRPGCHTDRKHHTHCSQSFVSPDWIPPGTYSWQP